MANAADGQVVYLDTFTSDVSVRTLLGKVAGEIIVRSVTWSDMSDTNGCTMRLDNSTGPPVFVATVPIAADSPVVSVYFGRLTVHDLYLVSGEIDGGKLVITLE